MSFNQNGKTTLSPTQDVLRAAFAAGFQSIDEGYTFYTGFDSHMESSGYTKRDDIPCTCPDDGHHGHMPECRWVRA